MWRRRNSDTPKKKRVNHSSGARFILSALGFALIALSPVIGLLPGPGFVILFPVGLALVLQNSRWAKKRYVDFKRRWPRTGRWTDWALRRPRHSVRPETIDLPIVGEVRTDGRG